MLISRVQNNACWLLYCCLLIAELVTSHVQKHIASSLSGCLFVLVTLQECYGVPYIPEGQWHCRRCMMPTGNAQCQLCPNSEGALKQTEDGHWAHVICAMYMPRVNFKSLQLLEPIMNIDKIEKSRWQLKCAVCKAQPNYRKELHSESLFSLRGAIAFLVRKRYTFFTDRGYLN